MEPSKRFQNKAKQRCRTYVKYFIFLALVDPAGQAAVRQGILDDVFVGLCARLLVEFRSLEQKDTDVRSDLVSLVRTSDSIPVSWIPVYSALEGVDEVVESFSQSLSSFRLPVEGHEEKPSAESGLRGKTNKPTNDTHRRTQKHGDGEACTHQTCTRTHTRHAVKQGQTPPVVTHQHHGARTPVQLCSE